MFNGFFSLDAKFWMTIIPLLTKPGKVSRDFINGKRVRYSNPFQFYLTVSIIFFLILSVTNKYQEFTRLGENATNTNFSIIDFQETNKKEIDSLVHKAQTNLNSEIKKIDSINPNILAFIPEEIKDSIQAEIKNPKELGDIDFDDKNGRITKMVNYQKKHPEVSIDSALTSLGAQKTFFNRFLYTRAGKVNSFLKNTSEENNKLRKEIISYASVSIFIFLPFFTLFLRFIYIRRKFTYVEHLIFVFHTQTVFFILLTLFYTLNMITKNDYIILIFSFIFLIYLLIAMKHFYKQRYFKTFIKFLIINFAFIFMASIGFGVLSIITFILY
ncbi:MAG: DUF3667 domain-containing protein [Flavobacteriaceae bacterium]|nr:MAG: DUF3667 domain-containing protein [Flavobacteriaceae bacterium]